MARKGGEPTLLRRDEYANGATKERSVLSNGLRYLRVGGRGFCLGAEKTRSEENA